MIILAGAKTGGDGGTRSQTTKRRREGLDRAVAIKTRSKIRAMTGQGGEEEWPMTVEIEEMILPSTVPNGTGKHNLAYYHIFHKWYIEFTASPFGPTNWYCGSA
jgi:GTPase involved in cell partitioning and DNA repair